MVTQRDDHALDGWLSRLEQQGFGDTPTRRTILSVLSNTKHPLSAEEIWGEAQRIRPETGRATVYRLIRQLVAAGYLRRVHGYRNRRTFTPSPDNHHPMLICLSCGKVEYPDPALLHKLICELTDTARAMAEYRVTEFHVQFFGTCIACQSKGE